MTPDQPGKTGVLFASIVVVVVLGVCLSGALGISPTQSPATPPSLPVVFLGNYVQGFNGWLLPSNVLISTTFVANQSLNGFVGATVNVFPYPVEKGGTLYLGLYINGELNVSSSYNVPQSPAPPYGMPIAQSPASQNYSSFTPSLVGYTVNLLFLNTSLPIGTTVTITIYDTGSMWFQAGTTRGVSSYESLTSEPTPQSLAGIGQQEIVPYVLAVSVASDTS